MGHTGYSSRLIKNSSERRGHCEKTVGVELCTAFHLGCLLGINETVVFSSRPEYPPYPQSLVIQSVEWDFERLVRFANTPGLGGSDLWPCTWAADGSIYTGWGDGGGFNGPTDNMGRVSLGFARVIGLPPHIKGRNVWGRYPKYAEHPHSNTSWRSRRRVHRPRKGGYKACHRRCTTTSLVRPSLRRRNTSWLDHTISVPPGSFSRWKLTQAPGHFIYEL